ncbi:MAG: hypothetical protein ACRCYE_05105 [Sarcina sp.]
MPLSLRYTTTLKGNMIFTGNTLGLSQDTNLYEPGIQGSMGAFTSLNLGNQVGAFPPGTTLNYLQNGSEANLVLPPGSTVEYAELIWGGLYAYDYVFVGNPEPPSSASIVGLINDPVLFNGVQVFPDPSTAQQFNSVAAGFATASWYERSADVTALVQAAGTGAYTVEQVPALVVNISNYTLRTDHAGWTLAVIYSNPGESYKNIYLYNGSAGISTGTGAVDIPIGGFETLPVGGVNTKLFLSAQEGDGDIPNDQVLFGPTVGSLNILSGPNNAAGNFFGGQINKSDGTIDTTGTFGTRNNNVFANTNFFGGRHGWDITTVDVSPYMTNSQTDAVVRITTTGDAYMINAIGLVTDTVFLDIPIVKAVDKAIADIGDILTYTISFTNNSNVTINNVVLTDAIPNGTTFLANSLTIDGGATAYNPTNVIIPDMAPGVSRTVVFKVTVTSLPVPNPMPNTAVLDYAYSGLIGPTVTSNTVNTVVNNATLNSVKSVDLAYAEPGERLTYTTVITNNGSVAATNVVFTDSIPTGTIFVPGSVFVDLTNFPLANPSSGITIASIPAGASVTVTFKVDILNVIPTPNPILNANITNYEYTVDPLNPPVVAIPEVSNTVQTQVNKADLTIVKAVDKNIAAFDEIVTYTTVITNTGNVSADNVIFTDSIPVGTTFVPGSVIINAIPNGGANPASGINLGNIGAGASVTISFEVQINNGFPPQNPIPNTNGVGYEYTVNPLDPPVGPIAAISNNVLTSVQDVLLSATKSVDLSYADVGDIITYTVVINNAGNIPAINTLFQDNVPVGTSFIPDSLRLNGIQQFGADPVVGFTIPTIGVIGQVTITFEVIVDSTLPIPLQASNFATIDYPTKPPFNTNTVVTELNHAKLSLVKAVSDAFATTNQTIVYTTTITNDGNTIAENIVFVDSIPTGTTFVPNSVIIGGVPAPGENPSLGVAIPNLGSGASITVVFSAKIDANIPVPNPILNTSLVNYEYVVDPLNPPVIAPQSISNQVSTLVNKAILEQVKAVNLAFAELGDILIYTVNISNTGNVLAQNVQFFDLIPAGTTFISNSVVIDGIAAPGQNPSIGFAIPDIAAGDTIPVEFRVTIDNASMPIPNPIENQSTIVYDYQVDPLEPLVSALPSQSNIVQTLVNEAILVGVKTTSANVVNLGDTFTYQVIVTNNGNVDATNVLLTDLVPSGTTFVAGTVQIDGVPSGLADPLVGINIPDIAPNDSVTISFDVVVGGVLPVPNPMPNNAVIDYSHLVNPSNPPIDKTSTTNTVNTLVIDAGNFASFDIVKVVDKAYALLGDILEYTIVLTNTGTTEALNVVLKDLVPNGTSFIPNSVFINAVQAFGENPLVGINIGTVAVNEVITVTFNVQISPTTLPVPNPMPNDASVDYKFRTNPNLDPPIDGPTTVSNEVTTLVRKIQISPVKATSLDYATFGDVITYTIGIGNTGNTAVNNVILTDLVPNGTSFVPGTVVVGGVPNLLANPQVGISVGTINPSQIILITFDVLVGNVFPVPNPLENIGTVNYQYVLDPSNPLVIGTPIDTNPVTTVINRAIVNIVKAVDKNYADLGDIITYTLNVTNTGNVSALNTVITDNIPAGTVFVPNSVIVDGIGVGGTNPITGINIPIIASGQTVIVKFQVQVLDVIPIPNPLENFANGIYEYKIDPSSPNVGNVTPPSNIVLTQINHGEVVIVKAVDKTFADVNEEITYTFNIVSVGNVDSDNVILTDLIPPGTSFVANSVIVDGIPALGTSPITGINLGTVSITPVIVSFKVLVGATIPVINPIINTGNVIYEYLVDPLGVPVVDNKDSNLVETLVQHADLVTAKYVDKDFVGINGIITYTATITNIGNVDAINIVFKDTVPNGTIFVTDSVKVDGITVLGEDPNLGISILNIAPGVTKVISFKVQVDGAIPTPNPIPNTNETNYEYLVDPQKPVIVAPAILSNEVETLVNDASIVSEKSVDKTFADLSDVLKYTIVLTNTGNVTAENVIFTDNIPSGTTLVNDSVYVNGNLVVGGNPALGINIPNIVVGSNATIEFEVKVNPNAIPVPNPIPNIGTTTFDFKVNPTGSFVTGIPSTTNAVETLINNATLKINKDVDGYYKDLNEVINYTIEIFNDGNVDANNVFFKDILQVENAFVANTVKINGLPFLGYNPEVGFALPSITPLETIIVTFDALVVAIPTNGQILNNVQIDYTHVVDPSLPEVPKTAVSNTTIVNIRHGQILPSDIVKSADKNIVTEKDIITYSIEVTNSGNYKVDNVIISDILANGVEFVNGSVIVNGVSKPSEDPNLGINVGTIDANETITVTFRVKVLDNAPSELINTATVNYNYTVDPIDPPIEKETISNEVVIDVVIPNVTLEKSSNLDVVTIGDIITYKLIAKNIGEIDVYDVIIKDLLEEDIDFVEGSVAIDGFPDINADIISGVNIGALAIGKSKIITFKAKVIKKTNDFIDNVSTAVYKYKVEGSIIERVKSVDSNLNRIILEKYELKIAKTADKNWVTLDDTILYKVTLTNTGEVELLNVVFKDNLPQSVEFIENSLTVNGTTVNDVSLIDGVNVGSILPGEEIEIMYKVKVISGSSNRYITNEAFATFNYALSNGTTGTNVTETVSAIVEVGVVSFKQLSLDRDFDIPSVKPSVEELDDIAVEMEITNSYVVKVLERVSSEGQRLSGNKLIIHGWMNVSLEYTALVEDQAMHSAHWRVPFSTFIILPKDYIEGQEVEVTAIVENTDADLITCRTFSLGLMVLVIANIKC